LPGFAFSCVSDQKIDTGADFELDARVDVGAVDPPQPPTPTPRPMQMIAPARDRRRRLA
jgi:hypothetical protein